MIPHDVDPTLSPDPSHPQTLDDGYSPPQLEAQDGHARMAGHSDPHPHRNPERNPDDRGLGAQSLF